MLVCIVQQVTAAGGREEGFGALTVHSPYAMCPEVSASALTDSPVCWGGWEAFISAEEVMAKILVTLT